jgi:Na+/proline symporter
MEQVSDELCGRTPSEKRTYRRYLAEFLTGMALYSVLLGVSVTTLRHHHVGGIAGIAIELLPMLGVLGVVYAIVHYTVAMDEFKRRITVDAAATAAVAGGVITMGLGFLENAGVPRVNMIYAFPIIIAAWGFALLFFWRRYR